MTERQPTMKDLIFVPRGLETSLVTSGSFITGRAAEAIYAEHQRAKKEQFNDNSLFQLKLQNGELVGSTLQDAALVNQIISQYGGRVLLPSDLHNDMTVPNKIKDRHYVDKLAIIARGPQAQLYDERGQNIAETLEARDEIDVNRLKDEPALITGFRIAPASEGYGFVFQAPQEGELKVVYSDKFHQSWHNKRFNNFDENGVPTDFAEDGRFRNYTGEKPPRVSGFGLSRNWDSDSGWDRFDGSNENGRVVSYSAEGGAPDFSRVLKQEERSELLEQIYETRQKLESFEKQLRQN